MIDCPDLAHTHELDARDGRGGRWRVWAVVENGAYRTWSPYPSSRLLVGVLPSNEADHTPLGGRISWLNDRPLILSAPIGAMSFAVKETVMPMWITYTDKEALVLDKSFTGHLEKALGSAPNFHHHYETRNQL